MYPHGAQTGNYHFFNETKFIHVCFFAPNLDTPPIYTINNKTIEHKTQHKDLGLLYCYDLSWTEHYNYIILYLRHTRHLVFSVEHLKVIMYKQKNCYIRISLVRSQLVYCSQIYMETSFNQRYFTT